MKKLSIIFFIAVLCGIVADSVAQTVDYKTTMYKLFVGGKIRQWGTVINMMEKDPNEQNDKSKLELLGYYYGYIGHLLDVKNKNAATVTIKKAEDLISKLSEKYPNNALIMGYRSNITGFLIALNPIKATVLAKGMMQNAKKAINAAPNNPEINILTANIFFYMPDMLGGNSKKALAQYHKALDMFESNSNLRENNWMYLQLLVTTGIVEEKEENYDNAKNLYLRILEKYPDYSLIRDYRYPNLLKKMES